MISVDRGAGLRVFVLAAISLAVLASATAWECPLARGPRSETGPVLTLELTAEGKGQPVAVGDGQPIQPGQYLHVSGTAPAGCHLFVVAIARVGPARAWVQGEGGFAVGPGPYRVRASYDVSDLPGPLRVWAVCGSEALTYRDVLDAAHRARMAAGGGDRGVREADVLTGLPDGILTATRVVERSF